MDPDADVPIVSDDRERRSRGKPEGAFRSRRDGRDADSRRPVDGDEPSALDAGDRIVGDSGGRVPVDGPRSERERPDSSAGDSGEQRSRRGGRDRSSVAEFESGDVSRRNPGRYASTSRAELRVGDRREGEAEPGPDATRGSISRSRRDVSVRRSRDGLEDRQPSRRDVSSSPSHRRGLSREEEASPTGHRESIDAARGRGGEVQQSMASVAIPKPTLLRPKDAENLPEVHFIGDIVCGTGFPSGVSCKWAFEFGDKWEWLHGYQDGQTQTDYPGDCGPAIWSHPLDAHLIAGSIHGWPRLLFQVWQLDDAGRADIAGYGYCSLPCTAGSFQLTCPTWRPCGTESQELVGHLLGTRPQLKSSAVISTDSQQRYHLTTIGSGSVHVEVSVVLKNFDKLGLDVL